MRRPKGYEVYMEGRVLALGLERRRKELVEEWKAIRRGWCVGGTGLQTICRLKREGPPELERLKGRLEQVYGSQNGEVAVRICDLRD